MKNSNRLSYTVDEKLIVKVRVFTKKCFIFIQSSKFWYKYETQTMRIIIKSFYLNDNSLIDKKKQFITTCTTM